MNDSINTTFDKSKCIDLPWNDSTNGNQLQLWNCHGGEAQEFSYIPTTLQIKHLPSNKCVDLHANIRDNGNKIQLWDCHSGDNQQWKRDGNLFKLNNTNKCIDIPGGDLKQGNKLQLWDCNNTQAQQFDYTIHPCDNPDLLNGNPQLQSACDCRKAMIALKNSQRIYQNQMQKYNDDMTKYNDQMAKHTRWRNKSGEYSNWKNREEQLRNDSKPWNNCVDWLRASGSSTHEWCRTDHGSDWYHSGATGEGCFPGFGKGLCKLTNIGIDNIIRKEGYYALEPSIPLQPQIPTPPTGNNIVCCSQLFSNINASNVNFENISQNCSQIINNNIQDSLKKSETPSQVNPPSVSPPLVNSDIKNTYTPSILKPINDTSSTSGTTSGTTSKTTLILSIVLLIIIIIITYVILK